MNKLSKHELININKEIELSMVETSKDKMIKMMDSNDEHSIQFSMFIKSTYGVVYDYINENPPPFKVFLQQSAYAFAAAAIGCIFEAKPLRDLVRDKQHGLIKELAWDIEFTHEYMKERKDEQVALLNNRCTRMFNLVRLIIKSDERYSAFVGGILDSGDFNLSGRHISEYNNFLYVARMANSVYIQHLESFASHMKFADTVYNMQYKQSLLTRTLDRLPTVGSVENNMDVINKESAFLRDSDITNESYADEWVLMYTTNIINQLDFLEVVNGDSYGTVSSVVAGTESAKEEMKEYIEKMSVMRPTSLPIIINPIEWSVGLDEGGFHHIDAPLVPARKHHHKTPDARYLSALNRIQGTAFKTNHKLLDYVNAIGYRIKTPKRNDKSVNGWTNERYRRLVKANESKNNAMDRIIAIASDYNMYDRFWFTMYCDFRYRMYYRQEYFSPQGQDLSKALLEFDIGKPVDRKALRWIRINVANLGGYDNISMEARVAWVKRNESLIRDLVTNPKPDHVLLVGEKKGKKVIYREADKPWQFIAACMDYVDYLDNPTTHLSSLPVGMDGKCNGTQHWCAMLKDKKGGEKVALTRSTNKDKPSDLYTEVWENLDKLLNNDLSAMNVDEENNAELAKSFLLFIIDGKPIKITSRKMVKTPTMTTTYSAGKKAFRGYISKYCVDNGLTFNEDKKIQNKHVNYIVDQIIEAIRLTVNSKAGMSFVQECVKGKTSEVHWVSPLGAHVYMNPKVAYKREFSVRADGKVRKITFSYESDRMDNLAVRTGVSPNFVHMMDATHMAMTVNYCPQISHWMMIHDQFSCHAYHVDDMQKGIRKSFVDLYSEDQLYIFREQQGKYEDDVPLPTYGDLDLNEVIKSTYFFS